MSEIDPRAETPLVNWSDLGVSELLPTGTVTLLLADIEGSTGLWQTNPDEMSASMARLDTALARIVSAHSEAADDRSIRAHHSRRLSVDGGNDWAKNISPQPSRPVIQR